MRIQGFAVGLTFGVCVCVGAACSHTTPFDSKDASQNTPDANDTPEVGCRFAVDASLGPNGCHACTEGSCCDLGNECLANASCRALIACLDACAGDGGSPFSQPDAAGSADDGGDADTDAAVSSSCEDACKQGNRAGIGLYAALASCAQGRCGSLCP